MPGRPAGAGEGGPVLFAFDVGCLDGNMGQLWAAEMVVHNSTVENDEILKEGTGGGQEGGGRVQDAVRR